MPLWGFAGWRGSSAMQMFTRHLESLCGGTVPAQSAACVNCKSQNGTAH